MKRIANNVCIATLLYTVSGKQNIRIIDCNDPVYRENGSECIYSGTVSDLRKGLETPYSYYKVERARICAIEIDDDYLVLSICMRRDEF